MIKMIMNDDDDDDDGGDFGDCDGIKVVNHLTHRLQLIKRLFPQTNTSAIKRTTDATESLKDHGVNFN